MLMCLTIFKIFPGSMPPDPPSRARAFGARIFRFQLWSIHITFGLATPLHYDFEKCIGECPSIAPFLKNNGNEASQNPPYGVSHYLSVWKI